MTDEVEELRRRVIELEYEVGEAVAARVHAEERAIETETALQSAYDTLAAVMDPLFASTFDKARRHEIRRLRDRIRRLRRRNERLRAKHERIEAELATLRSSWAVRWSAAVRRAVRAPDRPAGTSPESGAC